MIQIYLKQLKNVLLFPILDLNLITNTLIDCVRLARFTFLFENVHLASHNHLTT